MKDSPPNLESVEQAIKKLVPGLRDFRVEQNGHGVILIGRCRTYYIKQLAQHRVMELGHAITDNRIVVEN